MRCQYLAAILTKRVKRFSPLPSPLECLTLSAGRGAYGAYGFAVGEHGIGKHSDKGVPYWTMHGTALY